MDNQPLVNKCNISVDQRDAILYAMGIPAIFSTVLCIVAILAVVLLGLSKLFIYRLTMYQVLGSLCQSFSMAFQLSLFRYSGDLLYYRVICRAAAFLLQYSLFMKLMFTVWLTIHLFSYVIFFKNLKSLEWIYLSSSLLVPFLIACIPLITHSYGIAGAWCYIRSWKDDCSGDDYKEGIAEQFALYYVPTCVFLTISVIAVVIMVVVMVQRACVRSRVLKEENQPLTHAQKDQKVNVEALKQLLPLLAYPIIYFTLIAFAATDRVYMAVSSSKSIALIQVHAVAGSLIGTFSSLVLFVHICIMWKPKKQTKIPKIDGHFSTYGSMTPYSSGADTNFTLPNETDVEGTTSQRTG